MCCQKEGVKISVLSHILSGMLILIALGLMALDAYMLSDTWGGQHLYTDLSSQESFIAAYVYNVFVTSAGQELVFIYNSSTMTIAS